MIMVLLRRFKKAIAEGHVVDIYWYYPDDDDEIMESGEDFGSILKLKIKILPAEQLD